jgi:hypothetical protein
MYKDSKILNFEIKVFRIFVSTCDILACLQKKNLAIIQNIEKGQSSPILTIWG